MGARAAQQAACRPSLAIELARTGRTGGTRLASDRMSKLHGVQFACSDPKHAAALREFARTHAAAARSERRGSSHGLPLGLALRALMSRLGRAGQIVRRVDEGDM